MYKQKSESISATSWRKIQKIPKTFAYKENFIRMILPLLGVFHVSKLNSLERRKVLVTETSPTRSEVFNSRQRISAACHEELINKMYKRPYTSCLFFNFFILQNTARVAHVALVVVTMKIMSAGGETESEVSVLSAQQDRFFNF